MFFLVLHKVLEVATYQRKFEEYMYIVNISILFRGTKQLTK
jgi:hypothetical protein